MNINKYVIAYLSLHEGELKQEIILASSKLEAVKTFLKTQYDFSDLSAYSSIEQLEEYSYNCDAFINVIEI